MDIINNWITLKLGLKIPQTADFEKTLANGVVLAEILRKYGLLSDDEKISLKHDDTEATRLGNIQHIERWLSETGLKIKTSELEGIAMEKTGVGIKLLYELYLWFEFYPRAASQLTGDGQTGFEYGKNFGAEPPFDKTPRTDVKERCAEPKRVTSDRVVHTSDERLEFVGFSNSKIKLETKLYLQTQPQHAVLLKPFIQTSECAQAQHLYFCLKTIEVLQKQNRQQLEYAGNRHRRISAEKRLPTEQETILPKDYAIDSVSMLNRQQQAIEFSKERKLRQVFEDMDKFDLAAVQADGRCDSDIPIYADGFGDACEYELKVRQMRFKRQLKQRRADERAVIRVDILNRYRNATQFRMTKQLESSALSRLTELPTCEKLFASYLQRTQSIKQHFYDHRAYEARQLQKATTLDLNKEIRMKLEDEEFIAYAAAEQANTHKTFDFVCRLLEEPDLLKRLSDADHTIRDMMQRALKFKPPGPPPPPPCTPTFIFRKLCKQVMDQDQQQILVCEDAGESGVPEVSYCIILNSQPKLDGEQGEYGG